MKSKMVFSLLAVLGVFLAVLFYFRTTSKSTSPPTGDPSVSEMDYENKGNEKNDENNLPIAIILYDRVNFESIENEKDILILNSGDFLRVVEASSDKPGVFKVQNKIGRTGWVQGSQFLVIPDLTEINDFYYSMAPLSTLFNEQSEAELDSKKKYDVFISADFLSRAKLNQDPIVSTWAKDFETANKPGATPDGTEDELSPDN